MRAATLLAVVVCLCGAATAAGATRSTLVWIPSTDIQATQTWHLGIDDYFPSHEGASAPTDVGFTYGGERWEAGVDYFGGTDDPLAFNAKALLAEETADGASFALGIYGVGADSDTTAYNVVYALASKTFKDARVTAGWFKGRRHLLGDDDSGFMLGVDASLSEKWWGAVDFQGGDSAFGATGIGAAYALTPDIGVLIGFVDFHDSALDDTITTQLDVTF